jgi:peroxiredoxin
MTTKFKHFLSCFCTFLLLTIFSLILVSAYKIGCRIDLNFAGLENRKIIFAYEYGNRQIVLDTIKLDATGKGFYSSKDRLSGGIYVVVFPNNNYLEFLISDEQFFTIISDTADLFKHLYIEGSDESELFRQYQVLSKNFEELNRKKFSSEIRHDTILKNPEPDTGLISARKRIDRFTEKIFIEKPNSFLSVYLKMQKDPQVPENLIYKNPEPNFGFILNRYKYVKSHYFDNITFSDTRILRTQLIYEKLDYYFNHFITQEADSLISAIDFLAGLSKSNDEAYHFTLNFLNSNFRNPKNPNQEKAYVHLADKYYLNGKSNWADHAFLKLLKAKVDAIRPTLLGNKAPDLELNSSAGRNVKLQEIKSDYLVVCFWSPDCNECQKEILYLDKFYEKYKSRGLEIMAIYTHADKEIWLKYIKEHKLNWINAYDPLLKSDYAKLYNVKSIPKLFLLDKNKIILAKDINIAQLELFMKKI